MLVRAHGVVVSRLLRMPKALGSNPSGSMFLREFFCEAVVQSVARNMAICRYGNMRPPGIEPGAQAWEACMLPLHYRRGAA